MPAPGHILEELEERTLLNSTKPLNGGKGTLQVIAQPFQLWAGFWPRHGLPSFTQETVPMVMHSGVKDWGRGTHQSTHHFFLRVLFFFKNNEDI